LALSEREEPALAASATDRPEATETVAVDLRVRLFLAALRASGWPPMHERTPRQARHEYRILAGATSTWRPVGSVRDAVAPGPVRDVPVRVYRPRRTAGPAPLVVYLHGGGFVIGDLFTADSTCRSLAHLAGATVVSVHYRRTPEHPLPGAHDDAVVATRWALAHAAELGADPARLVLAGDSAGGGLAAHVVQHLRDHGPRPAALQLLFYPATDFTFARTDRDPALAKLLDWPTIDWFAMHSLPPGLDRTAPTISPMRAADLSGLPAAFVVTAGVDPFRSDAIAYCAALRTAGVRAVHRDFPGQIHGFVGMDLVFPAGRAALAEAAAAILRVEPVPGPLPRAAAETVCWSDGLAHRGRRTRELAQRLPVVNGAYMITNLLDHRLRSALARVSATPAPGGHP
jgi:acetyl esterase